MNPTITRATNAETAQAALVAAAVALATTVTRDTIRDGVTLEEIRAAMLRCGRARAGVRDVRV